MGIIHCSKKIFISLLRYLNTKHAFNKLFYWIYEIRNDELKINRYMALEMPEGHLFGCYDYQTHGTFRNMVNGSFEENETKIIKTLVPHFECFIDIGAHIGYYSCLIKQLNPKIAIIAFEPYSENIRSLEKNLKINNAKAIIHPVGLGIKKENLILYGNDASASIIEKVYRQIPKKKTSVDIDKLDNYSGEIPTGSSVFIKIDVEGNEFFILKGSNQFIKNIRPIGFIIEIVKDWSGGENLHFFDTFIFMKKYRYDGYFINNERSLEKIGDIERLTGGNYVFLRRDISDKLNNI